MTAASGCSPGIPSSSLLLSLSLYLSYTDCVNILQTMLHLIVAALTPQCQGILGFPRPARFGDPFTCFAECEAPPLWAPPFPASTSLSPF